MDIDVSKSEVLRILQNRIVSLKSELKRTENAFSALNDESYLIENSQGKADVKKDNSRIRASAINFDSIPITYSSDYKWDTKILYILSKIGTAFKEDVISEISRLEPVENVSKLSHLIAVKLSNLLKAGVIKAEKVGRKSRYQINL